MRNPSGRTTRVAMVLAAAALVAGACGGHETPLEIGFRRVALDLAFKDADKALPAPPAQIVRQFITDNDLRYEVQDVPEAEEGDPTVVRRVVRVVPPRVKRECPAAPDGAAPEKAAFAVVKEPPRIGTYPRHNEGKLNIQIGTSGGDVPVPPLSKWDIPALRYVKGHRAVSDGDLDTLAPPDAVREDPTVFKEMPEFELTRRLLPGYSVTDTFRYTYTDETGGDYLYLVKRVTVARGEESVFVPSPPIRVVRLNVPEGNIADAGVVHAGIDRETNVALAIESQIVGREIVDVCGEVVDTYRVQVKEHFVDLSKDVPETSGNEGDTANFWNIQFDNGLLIVREEVHSVHRTTTEVLGQQVPVQVTYDYVSTLDALEPQPLAAPQPGTPSTTTPPDEDEG